MKYYADPHNDCKAPLTNSDSLSYSRIALTSIAAQLRALHDGTDMDEATSAWMLTLREQLDCVIDELDGGAR